METVGDWIVRHEGEFLEDLKRWIRYPSISRKGEAGYPFGKGLLRYAAGGAGLRATVWIIDPGLRWLLRHSVYPRTYSGCDWTFFSFRSLCPRGVAGGMTPIQCR